MFQFWILLIIMLLLIDSYSRSRCSRGICTFVRGHHCHSPVKRTSVANPRKQWRTNKVGVSSTWVARSLFKNLFFRFRCQRELHISYHNGDHYNSVRKIGDLFSNEPANLKIDVRKNCRYWSSWGYLRDSFQVVASASNQYEDADSVDEDALTWSDSENDRKSSTANGTSKLFIQPN